MNAVARLQLTEVLGRGHASIIALTGGYLFFFPFVQNTNKRWVSNKSRFFL